MTQDDKSSTPTPPDDAKGGPDQHLGASDHVGQPRKYAESALDALDQDPLPEAQPGEATKDEAKRG